VRLPTRTGLVLAVAALVVALPTAAGALPSGTASSSVITANSQTYQDSTGENAQAPDITTLVVSNNDAGVISFRINVPNRPALGQDMLIALEVDTDNNAATGSPDGTDYAIELTRGEIALFRWDGANFTRRVGDPPATSLVFSYQGGVTITINSAELGNARRMRFNAIVVSGVAVDPTTGALDFTNAQVDFAPAAEAGLYPYEVTIARPTLVVRGIKATPAAPRAGRTFSLRLTAARSDTNAVIQNGRVACVGRVGTSRLRAQLARVQGGAAVCTWQIPAKAKGKSFRGSVAVVFEGLRASRSYSARIR
jgi:hypothetical protein